jgi:membrane protease YdiL (CAAX protease family)
LLRGLSCLDIGAKKAILLFFVLFITWQAIYCAALIFPILNDYWLISYLAVLVVVVCFFIADKQKMGDLGLKKTKFWKISILIGIAFAVIYNIYWIVMGTPIFSVASVRFASHGIFSFPYNLLFALTVSVVEEITFRGYILRNFSNSYSNRKAIIYSSILFGLYHFSLTSALTSTMPAFETVSYWLLFVLAAVLIGVFLGYFYIYTDKSTVGSITYHSSTIFIESLIPFTLATSQITGHLLTTTVYILLIPLLILLLKKATRLHTKQLG